MSSVDLADCHLTSAEDNALVLPRRLGSRDRVLPIFIVASLIVHAVAILPSLLNGDVEKTQQARNEIPVELVQAMPKPPARQAAPKQEAPKQEARQVRRPPPKQASKQAQHPPPRPTPNTVADRFKQLIGPLPEPAIALPSASDSGSDEVSYAQLVLSKVAKAKKEGRYNRPPGAASVAFTLGDSGEVLSVKIVRPSGDPTLDDEAIAMVKRGAPYPPPPTGGQRDYAITLRFDTLI